LKRQLTLEEYEKHTVKTETALLKTLPKKFNKENERCGQLILQRSRNVAIGQIVPAY
jgi:hypothetical protein